MSYGRPLHVVTHYSLWHTLTWFEQIYKVHSLLLHCLLGERKVIWPDVCFFNKCRNKIMSQHTWKMCVLLYLNLLICWLYWNLVTCRDKYTGCFGVCYCTCAHRCDGETCAAWEGPSCVNKSADCIGSHWRGCDKYFVRCISRRRLLHTALQSPSKVWC